MRLALGPSSNDHGTFACPLMHPAGNGGKLAGLNAQRPFAHAGNSDRKERAFAVSPIRRNRRGRRLTRRRPTRSCATPVGYRRTAAVGQHDRVPFHVARRQFDGGKRPQSAKLQPAIALVIGAERAVRNRGRNDRPRMGVDECCQLWSTGLLPGGCLLSRLWQIAITRKRRRPGAVRGC